MDNLIKLENISFAYKKHLIYEDLNLTVQKGDVLAVLGHNGAGKTTLLKIMAGLLKIQGGNIEKNVLTQDVGFMNEALGLYPFLNAKENLELLTLRHNIKYSSSEIESVLNEFILNSKEIVEHYSTGMKKKLSLLGVLLTKPKLFLLDEPFSGIDPVSKKYITEKILENENQENAFVIVNHDLQTSAKLCNKFLIINEGKIVFYSDKKEDIENLEAIYLKYSEGGVSEF